MPIPKIKEHKARLCMALKPVSTRDCGKGLEIMDETTSSLDADNEREIQKAFDCLMKDKTVLVIAHRLNTIEKANQILVMDGGRIREAGSHEQLMELNGWYAHAIQEQKKAQKWTVVVRD